MRKKELVKPTGLDLGLNVEDEEREGIRYVCQVSRTPAFCRGGDGPAPLCAYTPTAGLLKER